MYCVNLCMTNVYKNYCSPRRLLLLLFKRRADKLRLAEFPRKLRTLGLGLTPRLRLRDLARRLGPMLWLRELALRSRGVLLPVWLLLP